MDNTLKIIQRLKDEIALMKREHNNCNKIMYENLEINSPYWIYWESRGNVFDDIVNILESIINED